MQNRNAYNLSTATASLTGASGSNQTISITVPATAAVASAIIPVTGLYSAGAEAYGGQYLSHVQINRGQTITLPVSSVPLLPSASSLALNPTSVTGGSQTSTATVTLSGPAPTAGAEVTLSSNNAAASVPPSVTVPAGSSSTTFKVNTSPVAVSTVTTIFASYDGVSPSASLSVTPSSGAVGLAVTADGSASTDTDATPIASYTFDFGDGSAVVGPQAAATATHTYTTGGTYTVTMTVTDSAGLASTATSHVVVVDNPPAASVTPIR